MALTKDCAFFLATLLNEGSRDSHSERCIVVERFASAHLDWVLEEPGGRVFGLASDYDHRHSRVGEQGNQLVHPRRIERSLDLRSAATEPVDTSLLRTLLH